ncbi:hypothetical protein NE237_002683 [Protea cynaroides]|uniref:Uncharacterized protein n=1 Tax=Protea cynaroides TaxID=273540 RepID=A0A9Q0GMX2_9MAGN|nr:hypothetical protein NE237_002683 [Protea cynaroides]
MSLTLEHPSFVSFHGNRCIKQKGVSREDRVSEKDRRRWVVTHSDANRVMTECYLQRDFFDLIDIDLFGSDYSFFQSAFDCLKIGGLLYVTSPDGYSSGGHRPHKGRVCVVALLIVLKHIFSCIWYKEAM